MIYADQRWIGDHGIGRFARNVLNAIDYRPIPLVSNPASPFDSWRLQRSLNRLIGVDLFFSPGYNPPLSNSIPFVFTIHDLNHIDRPENSSLSKRIYYAALMQRACHRAAHVLTVSEFSRQRIIEWSKISPERITNVRLGVDSSFHAQGSEQYLPYPYLLCVSNRKLHKNEFRTIQAFGSTSCPSHLRLVLTGNSTPALAAQIETLGLTSRVVFIGRVRDEDLPKLYRAAVATIFVSLYEGFGLPVLESMACGTPVLTSTASALPEAAGDAALLVDPTAVEEIALGMEKIVYDSSLRQSLREKGLLHAAKFSWHSTTSKVYETLLKCINK